MVWVGSMSIRIFANGCLKLTRRNNSISNMYVVKLNLHQNWRSDGKKKFIKAAFGWM